MELVAYTSPAHFRFIRNRKYLLCLAGAHKPSTNTAVGNVPGGALLSFIQQLSRVNHMKVNGTYYLLQGSSAIHS